MKKHIYAICAMDLNNGIGKNNLLPWKLKQDMVFFKNITTKTIDPKKQNCVIMGRKTWESIPESKRPLTNRINIVLTRDKEYQAKNAITLNSINEIFLNNKKIETFFVIGGAEIYKKFFNLFDGIYITEIQKKYDCDVFFPKIPSKFSIITKLGSGKENGITFDFLLYEKCQNNQKYP